MKVVILNKTFQNFDDIEHRAFTWVLNHNKYVKPDGEQYSSRVDYLGLFPERGNLLNHKDLSDIGAEKTDSLAEYFDLGYFIDTYGSYYQDIKDEGERKKKAGLIYGGLESEDVSLMQAFIDREKLVLAEFSIFGEPTPKHIRERAEKILGVTFTGWVGKYVEELNYEVNGDLPPWLVKFYEANYDKPYELSGPGIILVNDKAQMVILTEEDLTHNIPIMETDSTLATALNLDRWVRYPFWFEVCHIDSTSICAAKYNLHLTEAGEKQLAKYDLPSSFPSVAIRNDWSSIYMAGDFTDNPVSIYTSRFAGIEYIPSFLYDNKSMEDRRKFFWEWYEPFLSKILLRYIHGEDLNNIPVQNLTLPPSE